jgi:putative restriction endonuclease
VRVIRGHEGKSAHSPATGYRYDGLYQISDYWHEVGRDGFKIWRFRLVKAGASDTTDMQLGGQTQRVETTVQRIVRNTKIALTVKELHDHICQVGGLQLLTPAGPYAEAAHIRGLGAPHNGTDSMDNILCLCPNHHVLFDNGGIYIDDADVVREAGTDKPVAKLRLIPGHELDAKHVQYHRAHYVNGSLPG